MADPTLENATAETGVLVRYWAGARAAAGVSEESVPGPLTLAQLLDEVRRPRHVGEQEGEGPRGRGGAHDHQWREESVASRRREARALAWARARRTSRSSCW